MNYLALFHATLPETALEIAALLVTEDNCWPDDN